MNHVRIYGRVSNWGSHAQVTEGFRIALSSRGMLDGLMPLDVSVDEDEVPGLAARVGLLTGSLNGIADISPTHSIRAAVVAPNSSRIPESLAKAIDRDLHLVLATSAWARDVLAEQVKVARIISVPHGVNPVMRVNPELRERSLRDFKDGTLRFLHFSTTDRGRKGTLELLEAWKRARVQLPERSLLFLVLDPNAKSRLSEDIYERGMSLDNVVVLDRLNEFSDGRSGANPLHVAGVLSAASAIIQPSRGEGFGLIPLEARACGVPVIATTRATGHQEHLLGKGLDDGVVSVQVGEDAPIDDVPGGMAPELKAESIEEAILKCFDVYEFLHENVLAKAEEVQREWAWEKVIQPFVDEIEEVKDD